MSYVEIFMRVSFETLSFALAQTSDMHMKGIKNVFQLPLCHHFTVLCKTKHKNDSK